MTPLNRDPTPTRKPLSEVGDFLRSRRDRLSPQEAGVSSYGRRRVPGLRREEVAQLAGVSMTYLTRLEQGQSQHASEAVISALAAALRLDTDERAHLFTLTRASSVTMPRTSLLERATEGSAQLLGAMTKVPALLLGEFNDVLAWNSLGHRLLASHLDEDAPDRLDSRPNQLRMLFLDPRTRQLHIDWNMEAALAVASLRYAAARFADNRRLAELVGELSMNSPEFARLWAGHDVRLCASGTRRIRHPVVGALELHYEVLHLPETNGQRLLTHTAAPNTASHAALRVLASTR